MRAGLVGAGSMARALARGWGDPVLCTDAGSGRAQMLADELGGDALRSNAELAERADLVVLAHKPAQLEAVAEEVRGRARAVASILAGVPLAALRAAYPDAPVIRLMPNIAVEVGAGVICHAPDGVEGKVESEVLALFGRLGRVVPVEEELMEVAMALTGCGPAFVAFTTEAQVEAAARRGLDPDRARTLASDTLAGTAALLRARDGDAAALRRDVASPGGFTERGLEALQRAGVPGAFEQAYNAMLGERAA